jgi:hypothetical protein
MAGHFDRIRIDDPYGPDACSHVIEENNEETRC